MLYTGNLTNGQLTFSTDALAGGVSYNVFAVSPGNPDYAAAASPTIVVTPTISTVPCGVADCYF